MKSVVKTLVFPFVILMSFQASQASAACYWWQDCTAYQTKYPIVLVHGAGGFDSILGLDYWYRIPQILRERGADVHVVNVAALNSSEERGEQLILQVEEILAITGKDKVNLLGHSHGGLTSRYVAGVRPELVASVTTISTPNFGADLADLIDRSVGSDDSSLRETVATLANSLSNLIDELSGAPQVDNNALASLASLTTEGANRFNERFPDGMPTRHCTSGPEKVNGIHYFSWGGDVSFTNVLDPADYFLRLADSLAYNERNDGLVATCDMPWGKVINLNYNMNHVDTTNNLLGVHGIFEVDPLTVYRNHAIRLKERGL